MKLILHPKAGGLYEKTSPSHARYDELWERLVPASGMSATTRGEALRCLSNIYEDVYNDGGLGLQDPRMAYARTFLSEFCRRNAATNEHPHLWAALESFLDGVQRYFDSLDVESNDEESWPPIHDLSKDPEFLAGLEQLAEYVIWFVDGLDRRKVDLAEAQSFEGHELEVTMLYDEALFLVCSCGFEEELPIGKLAAVLDKARAHAKCGE